MANLQLGIHGCTGIPPMYELHYGCQNYDDEIKELYAVKCIMDLELFLFRLPLIGRVTNIHHGK